ncbi:probable cyclic nucleotide-gated ion channel 20, chloroplastic isoform X1 [Medicago truncatula]|uniref:probable cyclic nucleotide-gated ion channel 20, chloroplastic isoform X1 n=2 Tax=Medicago truncatula TaxID=3880 RepID=UPI000D2F275B|nr:probable cyclic nucleotide-gated ion channel 20, chloroplastic isoform X1 [Medicago truncatula]
MNHFEKDEITNLSETHPQRSDESENSNFQRNISRTQSAPVSIPMALLDPYDRQPNLVGHTGRLRTARKTSISQMSGPLYATPTTTGNESENSLHGDAKGFGKNLYSFCSSCIPGVMNPHARIIQQWNKLLDIFCLVAILVDPLFLFLFYVNKDKCIVINWRMATTLVVIRSIIDIMCFLNILIQFRLAYTSPLFNVVGAGELVDNPKKIALNYLKNYFFFDLLAASPLPQIILANSLGSSGANYAKNLLLIVIFAQFVPRLFKFLPRLFGKSPIRIIFVSAWANLIIALLIFHVVGSCWYVFGLQRVNQCLRDACHHSNLLGCSYLIDCDSKAGNISATLWSKDKGADACLNATSGAFSYGIYANAIPLTIETKVINKYVYALFWGFQQVMTLAGNQTPSYFVWEVLFTMSIIALGLLLLVLLIGNMQSFIQSLGKRSLEMIRRGRDVEQWMSHHRVPDDLRRRVLLAEWDSWHNVPERTVLENLPKNLQIDLRRHIFRFVKKVRIFSLLDEDAPILDVIRERLIRAMYMRGDKILSQGDLVHKMMFVVRGKLESIRADGIQVSLSEGDVCGEELLIRFLEQSSERKEGKKVKIQGQDLISDRTVNCLTNVEAFSLEAKDIEEVTTLFSKLLRSPHVQQVIRYESPYWRSLAATRIQVAWRYRKKRLRPANTTQNDYQTLRYESPYGKSHRVSRIQVAWTNRKKHLRRANTTQ